MVNDESGASIYNGCPACGQLIDVTKEEPFTKIPCPHCGNHLRVRCDFDQFLLRKKLGEGGMSRVYLADDTKLHRQVALKILNQRYGKEESRVAQFENEARLTAQINHPNVVRVFTVGRAQGYFYIAMELVGGGSLEDQIVEKKKLPEDQVLRIGSAVSQGLQAAHNSGLVHRDIKPGNILFSEDGEPKIVDFGLALMTQEGDESGEIWATPYYVPPEKLVNEPDDYRGDMYSLGATLFHAATGRPPHPANTSSMEELRVMKSEPVDLTESLPEASQGTRLIINRMLNINPADRFPTYEENINAFNDALALLGSGGKIPLTRRRAFWVGAAVVAILAALITSLLSGPEAVEGSTDLVAAGDTSVVEESQRQFIEARETLTMGKVKEAETLFTSLTDAPRLPQPARNWARINLALADLFLGDSEGASNQLQIVKQDANYSSDPGQRINVDFFRRLTDDMLAPKALPVPSIPRYRPDSIESVGLILNGMRHMNEGALDEAKAILEQFLKASPAETVSWIQDYKSNVSKALTDIDTVKLTRTKDIAPDDSLTVAEEKLENLKAAANSLNYPDLGRKILASHLETNAKKLTDIRKRETRKHFAAEQKLKTNEFDVFRSLCGSAEIHGASANFAQAASSFASTDFTSPEVRQAAADMKFLWSGADHFLTTLTRDVDAFGSKGELTLKGRPPLYAQVSHITPQGWTVRFLSSPDAATSSGELVVPTTSIAPISYLNMARRMAATISDSTEYYHRLSDMVCFAKVIGASDAVRGEEQTLLNELRDFRLRWTRIQEYDTPET